MTAQPVYPGYFADPFVLRIGGDYFAYGTGSVVDGRCFEILHSTDLHAWQRVGGALLPLADPSLTDYWAPEVAYRDGAFWLYYSAGRGVDGQTLHVARAEAPQGPFRDSGVLLTPHEQFAIDASPFQDGDDWYLYYAHNVLDGDRIGTMLAVDALPAPSHLAGRPHTIVRPSGDWQIYQRRRTFYGAPRHWHTVEGPFVRKRAGRYWCFYSGGNWQTSGYAMSVAVADSPLGPFRVTDARGPNLLAGTTGALRGPGHCSVVTDPDGQDWLVFHAWDPGHSARRMHVARLTWTAAGPTVAV